MNQEPSRSIISVQDLSKSFGTVVALDHVNVEVASGSITALLGPNGAGKTTLVRILSTLLSPDSGTAIVGGLNVSHDAQALRSMIGLAGQNAAVDEILTGRENLEMVGRLYHLSRTQAKTRAGELLQQFQLEDAADRILKTYSGGMRRRLDLAASLVASPKILFLDEPTTGLDPQSRFALWNVIRDLVAKGTTVLLTTQYLEEADRLADKIFVIDHGRIIAEGTADELKRQTGGDVLEIHVTPHTDASRAAELMRQFGSDKPHVDIDTGVVTMVIAENTSILVDVIRTFDGGHISITDISLRRPSLDEVFIRLTGHATRDT